MDAALSPVLLAIIGNAKRSDAANADLTHYTHENRKLVIGRTPLVLRPGSTAEVAEIVRLARGDRNRSGAARRAYGTCRRRRAGRERHANRRRRWSG